jgi:hypothetical protein
MLERGSEAVAHIAARRLTELRVRALAGRLGFFFVGGASPVVRRQMNEAVRRAAIVASALRPAYRPLQIALRISFGIACLLDGGRSADRNFSGFRAVLPAWIFTGCQRG